MERRVRYPVNFLCCVAVFFPVIALGDEWPPLITITASYHPLLIIETGSSVTVITAEEIEERHAPDVVSELQDVPGVAIARSGGPGQTARVFLRGADSNHTLVLIDGVKVNDPASPDGAFDFATLNVDNIERIEVLRGPQGTRYGSEAIGGVISIVTKRGGKPSYGMTAEAGSFQTKKLLASTSGSVENFHYGMSLSRAESDAISSVAARLGATESDGYKNTTFYGNASATLAENVSAGLNLRYVDSNTEYDDSFPLQDANNRALAEEFSGRGTLNFSLLDGKWTQELGLSRMKIDRDYHDSFPRVAVGERTTLDWTHHVMLGQKQVISFGVQAENQTYTGHDPFSTIDVGADNAALFLDDQFTLDEKFSATAGLRLDDYETSGSEVTYRIAPTYFISATGTRLKASVGTGFKAPSLFEVFDPFYGNPGLKPEKSRGFDAGFEQEFLEGRLRFGVTYFHNNIDNLIEADPMTFAAVNIGKATTGGVETTAEYRPDNAWRFAFDHTWLNAQDDTTGLALVRRPRHQWGFDAEHDFSDRIHGGLHVHYGGEREDALFPGRVTLKSYTLLGLTGDVDLTPQLTWFIRAENLLNQRYEEVYGFGEPGISAFTGLKTSF